MTSPENQDLPIGANDRDPSISAGNHIYALAKLLDELDNATQNLISYGEYESRQVDYEIPVISGVKDLYIPQLLKSRLANRSLETVKITTTHNLDAEASTTIEIHDEDGYVHISRDSLRHEDSEDTKDVVFEGSGKPIEIARIPNDQLLAFLYSLIGRYDKAEEFTHIDAPRIRLDVSDLEDSLGKAAITKTETYSYDIDGATRISFGRQSYGGNSNIRDFRIQYSPSPKRMIVVEADLSKGLLMKFFKIDEAPRDYDWLSDIVEKSEFYPDGGDITHVIEILESISQGLLEKYVENPLLGGDSSWHEIEDTTPDQ